VLEGGRVILYPAIDILDGKAVRLVEGRFEDQTVYHDDPLEAARSWVDAGARFLHIVDLDGALSGEPRSIEHLRQIVRETGMPVQYGGGLRSMAAVREAIRAGAERVIVGTAAFRDIDFLDDIVEVYGPRVVVSVDTRGGHVATSGWTQTTQMPAVDAMRHLTGRGVRSFVYTNVDRDGKLEGPDVEEVREIAQQVRGRFIYSGGIGSLEHLAALRSLRQVNLAGVITGKALYEGRFTIAEAQAALDGRRPRLPRRQRGDAA
jgi:phosphoribosylformimino-5-aminoimidazole carboxamide ribotide isomerase